MNSKKNVYILYIYKLELNLNLFLNSLILITILFCPNYPIIYESNPIYLPIKAIQRFFNRN